jgi:hypothetical protein
MLTRIGFGINGRKMKHKFLVIKAEHTVASYNGRDFTSKMATVCHLDLIFVLYIILRGLPFK